jgi:excisionase family DNA binding protein
MYATDKWLRVADAAERTRLSEWSIYQAISRGELTHRRLGGRRAIRLKPEWVDAWLTGYQSPIQQPAGVADEQ